MVSAGRSIVMQIISHMLIQGANIGEDGVDQNGKF